MRGLRTAAITAGVVVCAWAQPASAGHGNAAWGTSPADAIEAARANGEKFEIDQCPVPYESRNPQNLVVTSSMSTGAQLHHAYWFGRDGLLMVMTSPPKPSAAACAALEQAVIAKHGPSVPTPNETGHDVMWEPAGAPDTYRFMRAGEQCQLIIAQREWAKTSFQIHDAKTACHEPVKLGFTGGHEIESSDKCATKDDRWYEARPLRIEKPVDLMVELRISKPTELTITDAAGKELAAAETKDGKVGNDRAHARVELGAGCYLVRVSPKEPKTSTYYALNVEPYAEWKANDDLEREEELGEEGDEGPPTAYYPAIIMGPAPYKSTGRVHLHATAAIAMLDAGNMYGMTTSLGVEVNHHPRVRGVVGGSVAVMLQPIDDAFGTTNTMVPLSLWGGVRAHATPKIAGTLRAGVLGYHIASDSDEMVLGAIDRSENGSGYLLGLDVTLGSFLVGVERWLLGNAVTTFRLGFGF